MLDANSPEEERCGGRSEKNAANWRMSDSQTLPGTRTTREPCNGTNGKERTPGGTRWSIRKLQFCREANRRFASEAKQVDLHLAVVFFGCPDVEGSGGNFVDQGDDEAVHGQVERLEVSAAGVAGLDANRTIALAGEARQLGMVALAAIGAENAVELPLCLTQGAEQPALAAVAFRPEDGELGLTLAAWTLVAGDGGMFGGTGGGDPLGHGLQDGAREEGGGIFGRGRYEGGTQHGLDLFRREVAELFGFLAQFFRGILPHGFQQSRQESCRGSEIQRLAQIGGVRVCCWTWGWGAVKDGLLEFEDAQVEKEQLGSPGPLFGEPGGARGALCPRRALRHGDGRHV